MTQAAAPERPVEASQKLPVIDTDVHPTLAPSDAAIRDHLPLRWRQYLDTVGLRNTSTERTIPPQRQFTHRLDAIDPSGRPAVMPGFTRSQLLDEFDMSGVVLGDATALSLTKGNGNFPYQLMMLLCRAYNDAHRDVWMAADPRYYSLINIPVEDPAAAVKEIARCREGELGDRYVGVLIEPRTEYPIGNPKYWPIFEACTNYDIPVAFHVSPGRRMSACGGISYYIEWHTGFNLRNYTLSSSLIFEGAFDQFPGLKIALIELGWSWAPPFAWRLDASWRMLREEVPDLQRKPSEYLRDHFWFATQPVEEPERAGDFKHVLEMFEDFYGPGHLMFSSDYPHWDFDSPYESVPSFLPIEKRRKILGENASRLYKIPLLEGTGIAARAKAAGR